jgi:toxin ParE1/3/4
MSQAWKIRLTQQAEADLLDISMWTIENFSVQQAASYDETIVSAIEALMSGPNITGVRARHDIGLGIHTLHTASTEGTSFYYFQDGRRRDHRNSQTAS